MASEHGDVLGRLLQGVFREKAGLSFPEHHRKRLQSTNMLENLMRRLKKRSRATRNLIETSERYRNYVCTTQ